MKTPELTDTERLAEWETDTLPKALECFQRFIGNGCYKETLNLFLRDLDTETAMFCFYQEVLNKEEGKELYKQAKEIIAANKVGKLAELDNHLTRCGFTLDVAEFFYIKLKNAEAEILQVKVDALKRESREAEERVLGRLN